MNSPLRRALLHYAVRRKQAELSSGVVRNNSLWDKLVFNRIQVSYFGHFAPSSPELKLLIHSRHYLYFLRT